MKKAWVVLTGVAFFLAITFIVHAQTTTVSIQSWQSASAGDLAVMLQAVEATTPLLAESVPRVATFWSAQYINYIHYPPLPSNINNLPAWDLGDGNWLLADQDFDYEALAQQTTAMHMLAKAMGMDVSSPGDGQQLFAYTFDTNQLWLEITNVANGQAYLNLHNGSNQVYSIWSTTDLATPFAGWQVETEVWPTDTNCMPFTVPTLERPNLFVRAQDWTDVLGDGGIPLWWYWLYFGRTDLLATNLDSAGNTLLFDYTNNYDPNLLVFSIFVANPHVNTSSPVLSLILGGGSPYDMAVLVNDTNYFDAVWQPYSSNVVANLKAGDGVYDVWIGLRKSPANPSQVWQTTRLVLDTAPLLLVVTNPAASVVSQPTIQLSGYANEELSSLTFDVSNALGVVTGRQGYWNAVFYDTNLLSFTTNSFQCYDIYLADGLNAITVHAMDLAGNTTTTNVNVTLDYSGDTTPPALTVIWPPEGTYISGSSFTFEGQVDDATAEITARIVDAGGNTNTVSGLVERSGTVWINNLPVSAGANTLTITTTDAAGNSGTTSLTLHQSSVMVTMEPLTSDQLNQSSVTVFGTVSDATGQVYVNGVQAYYIDDNGDWEADGVPASPTGTARFDVEVYSGDAPSVARAGLGFSPLDDSGPNLAGSQNFSQPQPATVVMSSISQVLNFFSKENENIAVNWNYNSGGTWHNWGLLIDNDPPGGVYNFDFSGMLSTNVELVAPWENAFYSASEPVGVHSSVRSKVMIAPQGQAVPGATSFYLVYADAMNYTSENLVEECYSSDFIYYVFPGDTPLPPEWLQINGQT